ncbi:ATP-binding cassette domain-containing protein [Labrys neptuniae]|uniref:ABC transporter ATP-binding protein n=1 Tax=Labrys neptuniae TaxID=376174 RepID=UPI0028926691|nr:ATP-binding cassette domain-containing protein [Labrys neptuniae]MDT3378736.1 ATP-binding cassette domain-containing protein [Labrys neptuniae]
MLALDLEDIAVSFPGLAAPVLRIDRLALTAGSQLAVTGPSGSGKSTFVNVVTGLERVGQGRIRWGDTDIARLPEGARDRWRGHNIGLVMQDFHLFPGLSALENVLLPLRLSRHAGKTSIDRGRALLERVGLTRPDQAIDGMSRGEMQRVALARALLRRPAVLVADEPTASLDAEAGAVVGDLLIELASAEGSTLIVVSHDTTLTGRLARRLTLAAGRIASDEVGRAQAA